MCQNFLFLNWWIIFYGTIYYTLSIHSWVYGYLGCFYFWTIMNHAAMNIGVPVSAWTYIFISLGHTGKSGIAGSYGNSMFKHLRNCRPGFPSRCTILHFRLQCVRVSFFPTFPPILVIIYPCYSSRSSGVKWYFIVVFICISLITNNAWHLFMGLLFIFVSVFLKNDY